MPHDSKACCENHMFLDVFFFCFSKSEFIVPCVLMNDSYKFGGIPASSLKFGSTSSFTGKTRFTSPSFFLWNHNVNFKWTGVFVNFIRLNWFINAGKGHCECKSNLFLFTSMYINWLTRQLLKYEDFYCKLERKNLRIFYLSWNSVKWIFETKT